MTHESKTLGKYYRAFMLQIHRDVVRNSQILLNSKIWVTKFFIIFCFETIFRNALKFQFLLIKVFSIAIKAVSKRLTRKDEITSYWAISFRNTLFILGFEMKNNFKYYFKKFSYVLWSNTVSREGRTWCFLRLLIIVEQQTKTVLSLILIAKNAINRV
jgi:hypothetical protein